MQYFVPNCFVFQRKTLCRRSERVSCAPFSCRGTARGRPLFSSRGTGGFHQGTIRCGSGCFSCETGKLLPRESPPRLRNRFPTRLQKSWEGEGWGLGRGEGSLSPERFPLPSPIFSNFPYPRPLNCRLSPTLMVTRSRSKYSRSGMTYLRERPPESSLNPAGSRSSWEVNHACIRALSS